LRQADAAENVNKTRVVSHCIEPGIHPDGGHSIRTREKSVVKPGKSVFLLSKSGIEAGDVKSADVTLLRLTLDPWDHFTRFVLSPSKGVGSRDLRQDGRTLSGFYGAICRSKRLFVLAEFRVGERQDVIIPADLESSRDGLGVASREEQEPTISDPTRVFKRC